MVTKQLSIAIAISIVIGSGIAFKTLAAPIGATAELEGAARARPTSRRWAVTKVRHARSVARHLTSIKVGVNRFGHASPVFRGDLAMPTETAVVVAAIVLAFTGFALTLWWAERQTRDVKGSDQKADAPGLTPPEAREAVAGR
jgi:hypothetical protein